MTLGVIFFFFYSESESEFLPFSLFSVHEPEQHQVQFIKSYRRQLFCQILSPLYCVPAHQTADVFSFASAAVVQRKICTLLTLQDLKQKNVLCLDLAHCKVNVCHRSEFFFVFFSYYLHFFQLALLFVQNVLLS